MNYLYAFLIGGALCLPAQILLDKTKLTNARILTLYVVTGVALGATGIYDKLIDIAGGGATIPLTGFGNSLVKGVKEAISTDGLFGALKGGIAGTSAGISAAIFFAVIWSVFFKSKQK